MAARRPRAAAAPRPARPIPPAKTGLSKRVSRGRNEEEEDSVGGSMEGVDEDEGMMRGMTDGRFSRG